MIDKIFNCHNAAQQPTIKVRAVGLDKPLEALVDTGSMCVTWIKDKEYLMKCGAEKWDSDEDVSVTTANGNITLPVYRITLALDDVIFTSVPIALNPMLSDKYPNLANIYVILGAPVFRGMIYTIDTVDNKFNIRIPDNQNVRIFKRYNIDGTVSMLYQH